MKQIDNNQTEVSIGLLQIYIDDQRILESDWPKDYYLYPKKLKLSICSF